MHEIKRYKNENTVNGVECGMVLHIEGDFVKFEDVEALLRAAPIHDVERLLCEIKTLLLDVDTPTRTQRSDIVHRIAAINFAQTEKDVKVEKAPEIESCDTCLGTADGHRNYCGEGPCGINSPESRWKKAV